MNQILLPFLAGSLLCLLSLLVGLILGLRLGRMVAPSLYVAGPAQPPPAGQTENQRLLSAWWDLRVRLAEMALHVRQVEQLPQEIIFQLRDELGRLTVNLHQSLDERGLIAKSEEAKSDTGIATTIQQAPRDEIGHDELISNERILELLSQVGSHRHADTTRVTRFKYSAKQVLAPAVEDGPIAAGAFQVVQCHDISVRDIRYFVDEPPTETRVVIGLGLPKPIKWVAAEIEDSRTAYRYGRVGYLVTAVLVASIDNKGRVEGGSIASTTDSHCPLT